MYSVYEYLPYSILTSFDIFAWFRAKSDLSLQHVWPEESYSVSQKRTERVLEVAPTAGPTFNPHQNTVSNRLNSILLVLMNSCIRMATGVVPLVLVTTHEARLIIIKFRHDR